MLKFSILIPLYFLTLISVAKVVSEPNLCVSRQVDLKPSQTPGHFEEVGAATTRDCKTEVMAAALLKRDALESEGYIVDQPQITTTSDELFLKRTSYVGYKIHYTNSKNLAPLTPKENALIREKLGLEIE